MSKRPCADSVTIGLLKFTQIDPENTETFDDDKVGDTFGTSTVCDVAYCGGIAFSADGAVAKGTGGGVTAPLRDTSNYLWGTNGANTLTMVALTSGATVVFTKAQKRTSFNFYWGSIDSVNGDGFNNTLTVQFVGGVFGIITGQQVVDATKAAKWKGPVNGVGGATANDNQWFNVTASGDVLLPIVAFNAFSTKKAFEFDMAAPESSTWTLMLLGFAGIGFAGYRSARAKAVAAA